ncbi:MAG: DEAD/DEAH box helicase family protein, partial [FCB group bacterium]
MIVNLVLPIPSDRLFSYKINDDIIEEDLIGRRVLVPVGKRILTGVIVEVDIKSDLQSIKSIYEILDTKPVFTDSMLKFTKWISEYYFCSWGEVLKAALPTGMSPKNILRVVIIKPLSKETLRLIEKKFPKRAALLKLLIEHNEFLSINYLEAQLKTGSISAQLEALEEAGIIKCERVLEKDMKPKTQKALMINKEIFNNDVHLNLHQLNTSSPIILTKAIQNAGTSSQTVKALSDKKYIEVSEIEVNRVEKPDNKRNLIQRDETIMSLTSEQEKALNAVIDSFIKKENKTFLLHGVTGSGKTLVYIHAIKYMMSLGKTALLLVPEISLTPQLIDRFHAVFQDEISVLHSRMSEGERYDSWRNIYKQKSKIVIGARSA